MKRYNHNTYWGRSTLHIALLTLGNFSSKGGSSDNIAVLQVLICHSVCLLPSYAQMEDKCTNFLLTYRLYFQTSAQSLQNSNQIINVDFLFRVIRLMYLVPWDLKLLIISPEHWQIIPSLYC